MSHHSSTTATLARAFGRVPGATAIITIDGADGPLGLSTRRVVAMPQGAAQLLWVLPGYAAEREAFANAEYFALHLLTSGQLDLYLRFNSRPDDFRRIDWQRGAADVPLIAGCLARFVCRTISVIPTELDELVLGEVIQATNGNGSPLLHFEDGFGGFSGVRT